MTCGFHDLAESQNENYVGSFFALHSRERRFYEITFKESYYHTYWFHICGV